MGTIFVFETDYEEEGKKTRQKGFCQRQKEKWQNVRSQE